MRMRKGRNTVLLLLSLLFSMAAVAQRHEILNKTYGRCKSWRTKTGSLCPLWNWETACWTSISTT